MTAQSFTPKLNSLLPDMAVLSVAVTRRQIEAKQGPHSPVSLPLLGAASSGTMWMPRFTQGLHLPVVALLLMIGSFAWKHKEYDQLHSSILSQNGLSHHCGEVCKTLSRN